MTVHDLQIEPTFLGELVTGTKTFEVREVRDRNFQLGDVLRFKHDGHAYLFDVVGLMAGGQYGIEPGYVVMSVIRSVEAHDE